MVSFVVRMDCAWHVLTWFFPVIMSENIFWEITNDKSLVIISVNYSRGYKHIRLKFIVW